jgi:hypothetical protein
LLKSMRDRPSNNYIYGETFSREAPKPNPVSFEVLTQHIASGCTDAELHDTLNDIYKALAQREPEVVDSLDKLEQNELISSEENLVLCVLLIISKTLGPNLDFLRHAIVTGNVDARVITENLANAGLKEQVLDYLINILPKIKKRQTS